MTPGLARLLTDVLDAVPPDALSRNRVGLLARMHGSALVEHAGALPDVRGVPFEAALAVYALQTGADWIRPTGVAHSDVAAAVAGLGALGAPDRLHLLLRQALRQNLEAHGGALSASGPSAARARAGAGPPPDA